MEIFEVCHSINDKLKAGEEVAARNELIQLLDFHQREKLEYTPLVNHLIRATGLYPYIKTENAHWSDKFVYETFKVNVGGAEATLHREQSHLLRKLVSGENLAVSAPTSFGKSFVIDAFIARKSPTTVVLIVPTLALTDETRRRMQKKFGCLYKIITTPDVELGDKNILIFPQERAINYVRHLKSIDILIIDEFYKASVTFDKDRAPVLLKAILELGKVAKQRYFLAPNISSLKDSPFTEGMEFITLDFNTVFTEKYELYKEATLPDEEFKKFHLLRILNHKLTKTLIYAGTFTNIDAIANVLNETFGLLDRKRLMEFSDWIKKNYTNDYILANLAEKGIGIHNGKLHRSLSQIQIKLFEEADGLDNIISTSSIIEGVNTSAENVVIWANKNGRPSLNDFTYRNIVGRSGRMFRHFIGKVYLLEEPPLPEATQLNLTFTDDLLNSLDTGKHHSDLTREQIVKIIAFNDEMNSILGEGVYAEMNKENLFQSFNSAKIKQIASDMIRDPSSWNGLVYLNSARPTDWDSNLFKILPYVGNVGASYTDMVAYIKAISYNWNRPIHQTLANLRSNGITIEKFFELEKSATFNVASVLSDINHLQKRIFKNANVDISPFVVKLSNAFLPPIVLQLEEYGLPRMVSRKIHESGLVNFENIEHTIHEMIDFFIRIGCNGIKNVIPDLHPFEEYIIDYFFDGITTKLVN